MLLVEELALVSLNPGSGRHATGTRDLLNASLAGLLVAELMLDGVAAPGDRKGMVVLTERVATAPVLAGAAAVVTEKGPKIKTVLSAMSRGLQRKTGTGTWDCVMAGLVHAGVVAPRSGGARPRYELLEPGVRDGVVARLREAAATDGDVEIRTALVLSMIGPARLLEVVAPDRRTRRHARKRIDRALDNTDLAAVGSAVRALIAEATAAAATAAATVAITASSG